MTSGDWRGGLGTVVRPSPRLPADTRFAGGAICAERTAIVKGVSEGKRKFVALAVTSCVSSLPSSPASACSPCREMRTDGSYSWNFSQRRQRDGLAVWDLQAGLEGVLSARGTSLIRSSRLAVCAGVYTPLASRSRLRRHQIELLTYACRADARPPHPLLLRRRQDPDQDRDPGRGRRHGGYDCEDDHGGGALAVFPGRCSRRWAELTMPFAFRFRRSRLSPISSDSLHLPSSSFALDIHRCASSSHSRLDRKTCGNRGRVRERARLDERADS